MLERFFFIFKNVIVGKVFPIPESQISFCPLLSLNLSNISFTVSLSFREIESVTVDEDYDLDLVIFWCCCLRDFGNTETKMVGERDNPDDVPEYGPDDLDIFFSFKVHHGGQFDVTMDNYNGGQINYFDYISIDELSMLDLDEITMKLNYKLPMGYWIKLPSRELAAATGCGDKPTGFGYKPAGCGDGLAGCDDGSAGCDDWPAGCRDRPAGVKNAERAKSERKIRSDYDQDVEDIAVETCVDPTKDWDCLQVSDLPRGSGSDNDDGSEDLGILDGSNSEKDDARPVRKFIKRRYHKFNSRHDMQDPVFKLGMEFSSVTVFRKAIRAHSVKHRKIVKFKKNDPNRIRVICQDEGCKWFVFASWLSDYKTFKIKSLLDEHTCVMSFKNKCASSKFIAEEYLDQ
ncbi:hypothetical protein Ddye_021118 [Dipteronia dyeriana]|uniref:Transposase MuDR plant domain-containing protein n=1 Tax=Dipteronia dyeriana TaxID=168575 RepID=A0AAD9U1U7_9ROSI|nr:hypothetical protein Ddye_021118 [Dipteronia dyeriana]